ncbi:O-methyltransferase [Salegentibacter sediminis]|uniref:O-methyltransferase n=1 Tax=Salegentibacter sediminis TaxID=1930251 RepID=UPI0009C094E9|nr:class I SAM-dependent methyltransferase [Salegentibacter sediminis]
MNNSKETNNKPQTTNHKHFHPFISFFRFLLKSQNQHGLHSPFVYELVTRCFYDKTKYPEYEVLENYRKELLKEKRKISVTDFGAGSRVFKSKEREIAAIARNVGIPKKRAKFLFRLAKYLECRDILELGTSLGIGTSALALNTNARIISVEGCPETAGAARRQLEKFRFDNVELKVGEFEEVLGDIVESGEKKVESGDEVENKQQTINQKPQTAHEASSVKDKSQTSQKLRTQNRKQQTTFDLIYFDGHHTKEATLKYFELLLPTAHNDSVFIFDDIHWSAGMEEAWEIIKKHPEVRVSIDTFHLGLIFFRKEQAKQDFIIRL